jgi:hypothetical protein
MQRCFPPDAHTEANAHARAGKETEMDLLKNVEVVLMLGFGVLCAVAWAGQAPVAPPRAAASAQLHPQPQPIVVVITGKRLSAAEKRAFDAQARPG